MESNTDDSDNYPRALLIILGQATALFAMMAVALQLLRPIGDSFVLGIFPPYIVFSYSGYFTGNLPTVLSFEFILLFVSISIILFILLAFYVIRLIREYITPTKVRNRLIAEGSDSNLKMTNFLTYRRNGIPFYQLLTGSLLFIYFLTGHIYEIRYTHYLNEVAYSVEDSTWGYQLLGVTLIILIFQTIGLASLLDRLSLRSLSSFSNRVYPVLLFFAYASVGSPDNSVINMIGAIVTYPIVLLSLFKATRPVSFYIGEVDEVPGRSGKSSYQIPKWVAINMGLMFLLILLSFVIGTIEAQESNNAVRLEVTFYLLNLVIMAAVAFAAYHLTRTTDVDALELKMQVTVTIMLVLSFGSVIMDDIFFAVRDYGRQLDIVLFEVLVLMQIPAAIVLGVGYSYFTAVRQHYLDGMNDDYPEEAD